MKYLLILFILLFGCNCASTSAVSGEDYITRNELRQAYECLQARHEYERQAEICQSTITVLNLETVLCTNTCGPAQAPNTWAGDNECDDGGENSLYNICPLGTDCQDCGPRSTNGLEIESRSQEEIDIACALVIDYFDQCPGIR